MNKRGWIAVLGPQIILGVAVLSVAMLPFKTPGFRVQKAIDTCIRKGGAADVCKNYVAAMSKQERYEYTRDTIEHPQPMNEPLGG